MCRICSPLGTIHKVRTQGKREGVDHSVYTYCFLTLFLLFPCVFTGREEKNCDFYARLRYKWSLTSPIGGTHSQSNTCERSAKVKRRQENNSVLIIHPCLSLAQQVHWLSRCISDTKNKAMRNILGSNVSKIRRRKE